MIFQLEHFFKHQNKRLYFENKREQANVFFLLKPFQLLD